MTHDFIELRRQFPVLARKTYLNSGSYCALANRVKDAFTSYLDDRLQWGSNWDLWLSKYEAVRALVARLLNAAPDEIAVTGSASAGINALASAFEFDRRHKILVSDFEFPTNAQIWHAQEQRGAQVVHVPTDANGDIPLEHFEALIDEDTQLVAVATVCFRNGAKLDVAAITRLAHAKGAKVLLDCYQAVGANTVDVKSLDVDFAVGGMLKYLLGTAGIGFLFVRDRLISGLLPTNSGWFAQADIGAMDITANTPSSTARRFEAGTPPIANCYAAEAGLKLVLEIGTDVIESRVRELTKQCMERLEEIGWPSVTPIQDHRRGPMIAIESSDSNALCAELNARDIVTSNRGRNVRATFHIYNSIEDAEQLINALRDNRGRFK